MKIAVWADDAGKRHPAELAIRVSAAWVTAGGGFWVEVHQHVFEVFVINDNKADTREAPVAERAHQAAQFWI
jgi:hypothetical protein